MHFKQSFLRERYEVFEELVRVWLSAAHTASELDQFCPYLCSVVLLSHGLDVPLCLNLTALITSESA